MSTTHHGLWKPKLNFEFCVLVAAAEAVALKDGDRHIEGRWGKPERMQVPGLLEDFLNWPEDPPNILRFTKKYGPAVLRPLDWTPQRGLAWTFSIKNWRDFRDYLRRVFQLRSADWSEVSDVFSAPGEPPTTFKPGKHAVMEFSKADDGRVLLQLNNLSRYLQMSLDALPSARIKKCRRFDSGCGTPYFVAVHLRQEYCSDLCAHWGQKEAKKEWWKRRQNRLKGAKS